MCGLDEAKRKKKKRESKSVSGWVILLNSRESGWRGGVERWPTLPDSSSDGFDRDSAVGEAPLVLEDKDFLGAHHGDGAFLAQHDHCIVHARKLMQVQLSVPVGGLVAV